VKKENNDEGEYREAIELWKAACDKVSELHDLAQKRPELLRPIAREIFVWPGFISRKRAYDTDNAKLMDKIELGAEFSTKQWRLSATSTQFAMRLHSVCRRYEKQLRLPPLTTQKNKRSRFERAWNYAVNELGVVPENNPHLAKLGNAAVTRNINASAEDIRAEIKKQVRNAFIGLIVGAEK
jgi:hypothetical protein